MLSLVPLSRFMPVTQEAQDLRSLLSSYISSQMAVYNLFSDPISYPLQLLNPPGIGCLDQKNPSFLKVSAFFLLLALKEICVSSDGSASSAALSGGGCFSSTRCNWISVLLVLIAASRPFCFPPSQNCLAWIRMIIRLCYPHWSHRTTVTLQPGSYRISVTL